MSAVVETNLGEEDYYWREKHPERHYGMINPINIEYHKLGQGFEELFEYFQGQPPSEVIVGGKLHAVIQREENGNEIVSVLRPDKRITSFGGIRQLRVYAICMIKTPDGLLLGESHYAGELYRSGSTEVQIVEDADSVAPFNNVDIQTLQFVKETIERRHPAI
jgi:hypothetical protein